MNRLILRLPLFLLFVLLVSPAYAQTAEGAAASAQAKNDGANAKFKKSKSVETSEDLETLATLLSEDLQNVYTNRGKSNSSTNDSALGTPLVEQLPGYGVIIQMQIPSPSANVDGEPPAAIRRWKQTQNRLRGNDLVKARRTCLQCHSGNLDAAIPWPIDPRDPWHSHVPSLRQELIRQAMSGAPTKRAVEGIVMATIEEHAANVRHLTPDEQVTVSLSYDRTQLLDQTINMSRKGVEGALSEFDRVLVGRIDKDYSLEDMESFVRLMFSDTEKKAPVKMPDLKQGDDAKRVGPDLIHAKEPQSAAAIEQTVFPRFARVRISVAKKVIDQAGARTISKEEFRKQVAIEWSER